MSIKENWNKIKGTLSDVRIFSAVLILLVGFISYGLGQQSVIHSDQAGIYQSVAASVQESIDTSQVENSTVPTPLTVAPAEYIGSKNGTVYHLPWCAGANRISEENKVVFTSKIEAESKGYRPASNCKGI